MQDLRAGLAFKGESRAVPRPFRRRRLGIICIWERPEVRNRMCNGVEPDNELGLAV